MVAVLRDGRREFGTRDYAGKAIEPVSTAYPAWTATVRESFRAGEDGNLKLGYSSSTILRPPRSTLLELPPEETPEVSREEQVYTYHDIPIPTIVVTPPQENVLARQEGDNHFFDLSAWTNMEGVEIFTSEESVVETFGSAGTFGDLEKDERAVKSPTTESVASLGSPPPGSEGTDGSMPELVPYSDSEESSLDEDQRLQALYTEVLSRFGKEDDSLQDVAIGGGAVSFSAKAAELESSRVASGRGTPHPGEVGLEGPSATQKMGKGVPIGTGVRLSVAEEAAQRLAQLERDIFGEGSDLVSVSSSSEKIFSSDFEAMLARTNKRRVRRIKARGSKLPFPNLIYPLDFRFDTPPRRLAIGRLPRDTDSQVRGVLSYNAIVINGFVEAAPRRSYVCYTGAMSHAIEEELLSWIGAQRLGYELPQRVMEARRRRGACFECGAYHRDTDQECAAAALRLHHHLEATLGYEVTWLAGGLGTAITVHPTTKAVHSYALFRYPVALVGVRFPFNPTPTAIAAARAVLDLCLVCGYRHGLDYSVEACVMENEELRLALEKELCKWEKENEGKLMVGRRDRFV